MLDPVLELVMIEFVFFRFFNCSVSFVEVDCGNDVIIGFRVGSEMDLKLMLNVVLGLVLLELLEMTLV